MKPNCSRRKALLKMAGWATGGIVSSLASRPFLGLGSTGYAPVLSVQAYIWIQRLQNEEKSLADGVEEMLATFKKAGYRNVDLIDGFLGPALREKTLSLLNKYELNMPTFYANSTLHNARLAEHSMRAVIELAKATKDAGVRGIVTNPSPKPNQGRKTDEELNLQARSLNALGGELQKLGMRLMVHHHTPELVEDAREWRHQLANTDPKLVGCCVDVHWAYRGGQEPMAFLREGGDRLESVHLRNSKGGVWAEDFSDGDVDYRPVAEYLKKCGYRGILVVELAYEKGTTVTRSLEENLRLSRLYAEQVFGLGIS